MLGELVIVCSTAYCISAVVQNVHMDTKEISIHNELYELNDRTTCEAYAKVPLNKPWFNKEANVWMVFLYTHCFENLPQEK